MKIGFCYNVLHDAGEGLKTELDFDSPATIARLKGLIEESGHKVMEIEADETAFDKLRAAKSEIDVVFNIAEGLRGDARESQIPLFCEMLGIPYTHSSPTVHAVSLNKTLTKLLVKGAGVRVPEGVIVGEKEWLQRARELRFPVIVKPNGEGSSIGVFDINVVEQASELEERLKLLKSKGVVGQLIVEEYIEGREFTVGMMGNIEGEVLPIIEQRFDMLPEGMRHIAGYELKWIYEEELQDLEQGYVCPAQLDDKTQQRLIEACKTIYRALGVRGCARIDWRMDQEGELYFLEINTLPGLNFAPDTISYFPLAIRKAGMTPAGAVEKILSLACDWYGITKK